MYFLKAKVDINGLLTTICIFNVGIGWGSYHDCGSPVPRRLRSFSASASSLHFVRLSEPLKVEVLVDLKI